MLLTYNGIQFDERRSSTFLYSAKPAETDEGMFVKWIHVEVGVSTVFSISNADNSSWLRAGVNPSSA